MKKLSSVICILVACSLPVTAKEVSISEIQVNQTYNEYNKMVIGKLADLIDRESKVSNCMETYIKKQSKSYSKMIQSNLYDLMRNFNKLSLSIYGKSISIYDIPYKEKIEILAKIQCDVYYVMGILN